MKRTLKRNLPKYQNGVMFQSPVVGIPNPQDTQYSYRPSGTGYNPNQSYRNLPQPTVGMVQPNLYQNSNPYQDVQSAGNTPFVLSNDAGLNINPNQIVPSTPVSNQRVAQQSITPFTPAGQVPLTDIEGYETPEAQLQNNAQNVINGIEGDIPSNGNMYYNSPEQIQFFNPYGGVDIPTAAGILGSSIEEGDALGIVGSGLKLATGLGRNILGGMGQQRRNSQVMRDYYERQRQDLTRSVVAEDGGEFFFQDGGKMKLEQALTGEYIFGMDKVNPMEQPNAEIENNEVLQHPDGEIQTAKGNTHEKGGIDVKLEDGTKILSDHLKLGGDVAKQLNKKFNLELRASDTYAKALEKYNKKSGLSKIVEEQEETIKTLDKQDKIEDEETQGLNVQHLSNKINELEDSKKPLEEGRKEVFEELFERQEKSKPKNEKEEEIFEDGGMIKTIAEKYGLSLERAKELALPMFQNGGGYTEERRRQRFKDFYNQARSLGYEGDADPNAKDLNQEAGKLQQWMSKNHPKVVAEYAKGVDMTAKGVDIIKSQNPDVFKQAGVPSNKPSSEYTPEEKDKLKAVLETTGAATDDFWREQFQDNKWTFRYPQTNISINTAGLQGDSGITAPLIPNQYNPNEGSIPQPYYDQPVVEDNTDGNGAYFALLPDQNPMLPGSLQPHLKITRRFDRVNPALVSPEQNIVELNRQSNSAMNSIDSVPGAQRAASLASLSANTQDNINKVISETNRFNSQAISQADTRNAQIQAMEENAAAQDALSYEQRQYRAMALTDNDTRNYYNTLQANNARNYNEINNLNYVNAMADHYQFDGNGFVQTDTPYFAPVGRTLPTQPVKKRIGGRFKK